MQIKKFIRNLLTGKKVGDRPSDNNKAVNPAKGLREYRGIRFNRATFFAVHDYIAVSDALLRTSLDEN